jgi:pSer/pThr/pTyr-binding forkhead associated (FHA) protein
MAELWINYRDENGESGRVRVEGDRFTVGRGSSCDLVIPSSKLSRDHLLIERFGGRFFVTDQGSSNGTELNSRPLMEQTEIINGDRANLGGGADIHFEVIWAESNEPASDRLSNAEQASVESASVTVDAPPQPTAAAGSPGGFPIWLLVTGPLAAIFLLVIGIGILYLGGGGSTTVAESPNRISRLPRDPEGDPDDTPEPEKTPKTTATPGETNLPTNESTPPPANLSDTAKVEKNAAAFLRRIAQHDSTAFLTSEQAQKVNSQIKQLSSSQAIAANIESARKSSSQIKALAASKGLKPQFLANAALAKLGNTRGDALQTAQSMADIFEKLHTQIGDELSDDCLLMIAAFDQGQKGDFMGLRNMLQDLATKFPESSRSIRSIWFLQKQNKINSNEFEFAVQFIAIGAISQNPKDFGISAEPLVL